VIKIENSNGCVPELPTEKLVVHGSPDSALLLSSKRKSVTVVSLPRWQEHSHGSLNCVHLSACGIVPNH